MTQLTLIANTHSTDSTNPLSLDSLQSASKVTVLGKFEGTYLDKIALVSTLIHSLQLDETDLPILKKAMNLRICAATSETRTGADANTTYTTERHKEEQEMTSFLLDLYDLITKLDDTDSDN